MTKTSTLFSRLLVSAPNGGGFMAMPDGGGLLAIANGHVHQIDAANTTGLSLSGGVLARALQPNSLRLYGPEESYDLALEEQLGDVHDILRSGDHYYVVGTHGNTVGEVTPDGTVLRRWSYAGEPDACHVNCLALWQGRVVCSAFGDFDTSRGYKAGSLGAGFVRDLMSGEKLIEGLSQPHSLTSAGENLILANSEQEQIAEYDSSGRMLRSRSLAGYTRGICLAEGVIYVGLSADRRLPDQQANTASIVALDADTWEPLGRLSVPTREVYSITYVSDPDTFAAWVARTASDSAMRLTATSRAHHDAAAVHSADREALAGMVKDRDNRIKDLKARMADELASLEEHKNKELRYRQWERDNFRQRAETLERSLAYRVGRAIVGPLRPVRPLVRGVRSLAETQSALFRLGAAAIRSPRRFAAHFTPRRLFNAAKLVATDPKAFRNAASVHVELLRPSAGHTTTASPVPESNPLTSVLIINFNGKHHLQSVIPSLLAQSGARIEIIVVDNGSVDGSAEWLRAEHPSVRLLVLPSNVGFAEGTNIAGELATGDYLFLLNNDTWLEPDAIAKLVRELQAHPSVAAVSPKLLFWQQFVRVDYAVAHSHVVLDEADLLSSLADYKKLIFSANAERVDGSDRLLRRLSGRGHFFVPHDKDREGLSLTLSGDTARASIELGTGIDKQRHDLEPRQWKTVDALASNAAQWIINNAGSTVSAQGETSDLGYGHPDDGTFDEARDVNALCGCALLLRRSALAPDEPIFAARLFAYYEDTDLSLRLRQRGLHLRYLPDARVFHRHASTAGEQSPTFRFYVTRNRVLFLALHFDASIWRPAYDRAVAEVSRWAEPQVGADFLPRIVSDWEEMLSQIADGTFHARQRYLPRIAVYNSYWGSLGGGEYHAAAIAECLKTLGPVELISEREFDLALVEAQFGLDLTGCRKVIVDHGISHGASTRLQYDVFVNSTYGSAMATLSETNIYIVSFPHDLRARPAIERQFVKNYDLFLANSGFTSNWVQRYWGVKADVLYPAVLHRPISPAPKQRRILNVGRFFVSGHSKKQLELVEAFRALVDDGRIDDSWELVLAGQIERSQESYFRRVEAAAAGYNIRVLGDVPRETLDQHFAESAIYWHATGLGEDLEARPDLAEHFGISTVEAMLNGCVPIVIAAGGQPEIVEDGVSGFLFAEIDALWSATLHVADRFVSRPEQYAQLSDAARRRAGIFSKTRMQKQLLTMLKPRITNPLLLERTIAGLEEMQ